MNKDMIEMTVLEQVAPTIRIVAHPLRLRILDFLAHEGARNVSQIVEVCGVEQAVVSQQLRILKDQGILANRRCGNFVFYELKDRSALYLLDCIRTHMS
jgi:DNA-binding transcriptional ArsR family regulator